jgi:hypothetical protein
MMIINKIVGNPTPAGPMRGLVPRPTAAAPWPGLPRRAALRSEEAGRALPRVCAFFGGRLGGGDSTGGSSAPAGNR